MRVTVYTADVGRHDDVHPLRDQILPEDWEVSWRYLIGTPWAEEGLVHLRGRTDERYRIALDRGWEPAGLVRTKEAENWGDRVTARWAKCHPHLLFPEDDVTIWVDASMEITGPRFVQDAVRQVTPYQPYAVFAHPDRSTVREELEAAAPMAKYDHARQVEMVEEFERVLGGAVATPLCAMGVLVRGATAAARTIDHLVWTETLRWLGGAGRAPLDQLILPFVLDVLRYSVGLLESPAPRAGCWGQGTLWANDWFIIHDHTRDR